MKPGLTIGTTATVEDVVTQDMQPAFGGQIVHPVYGTAAMVYHMEWAARRIILPYLEDHEEGVGTGVRVQHLYPAPVGAAIVAMARCTNVMDHVITCAVEIRANGRLLGCGEVEQRVLSREQLHERFPELWAYDGDGSHDESYR